MKRLITALALTGLLAGCSSAPALHYYSLDADGSAQAAPVSRPQHQLVLHPVTLSDELDASKLVYQMEGKELYFTEYQRWAGSLDGQLNQLTQDGLSARLPGWVVRQDGARQGPVLTIRVQRFQGRFDGRAVLSGRWRLLAEDGHVLQDTPFHLERVLPSDGYGTLVSELGLGWQQLLDQIAAELRKE